MATVLEGGHTEAVLCTAITLSGQIISGGEGGQLCIWPADGGLPTRHTILPASSGDTPDAAADDVASVCVSRQQPFEVFVACGMQVLKYDIRCMKEPLLTFEENEDEVNMVVLHDGEDFLAACDDAGVVKVFSLAEQRVYKTLRKHTNICVCVAFRPRRPWDLLSAGFDYQLLQWDFSRGRSLCNIDMQEVGLDAPLPPAYMVSPPFVYAMSVSASGGQVACGTENALVQIFDAHERTLAFVTSLRGHTSGVSQVHFAPSAEYILISGGNDGMLFVWNLEHCTLARPERKRRRGRGGASRGARGQGGPGASRGITIGIHNGVQYGITNAVQNGIANGVQNGIANGVQNGIAHGVQNRIDNGVQNGIAHEVQNGIANGVQNVIAHGVQNGIDNGVQNEIAHGMQNGITHGVQNGIANGVENGIAYVGNQMDDVPLNAFGNIYYGPVNVVPNAMDTVPVLGVSNGLDGVPANGVVNEGPGYAAANVLDNAALYDEVDGLDPYEGEGAGRDPSLVRPRPAPVMRIAHGRKVNWLNSVRRDGRLVVIVADSSATISLYTLPDL